MGNIKRNTICGVRRGGKKMNRKSFEVSNINKMVDEISQIKQLFEKLSEKTKEQISNMFEWENKPLVVINHLEIVLDDCLEMIQEMQNV